MWEILSGVPIFLIIFISATITIQIMLKRNGTGFEESCKNFFEKEAIADKTIKKDFTDFPYVYADKNVLPIKNYPEDDRFKKVLKKQEQ